MMKKLFLKILAFVLISTSLSFFSEENDINAADSVEITYHFNDDGRTKDYSVNAEIDFSYALAVPDSWEGHIFLGWFTDPSFEDKYYIGDTIFTMQITGSQMDLYAYWVESVNVSGKFNVKNATYDFLNNTNAGIHFYVNNREYFYTADQEGNFNVDVPKNSTLKVEANVSTIFKPFTKELKVENDNITSFDIELTQIVFNLNSNIYIFKDDLSLGTVLNSSVTFINDTSNLFSYFRMNSGNDRVVPPNSSFKYNNNGKLLNITRIFSSSNTYVVDTVTDDKYIYTSSLKDYDYIPEGSYIYINNQGFRYYFDDQSTYISSISAANSLLYIDAESYLTSYDLQNNINNIHIANHEHDYDKNSLTFSVGENNVCFATMECNAEGQEHTLKLKATGIYTKTLDATIFTNEKGYYTANFNNPIGQTTFEYEVPNTMLPFEITSEKEIEYKQNLEHILIDLNIKNGDSKDTLVTISNDNKTYDLTYGTDFVIDVDQKTGYLTVNISPNFLKTIDSGDYNLDIEITDGLINRIASASFKVDEKPDYYVHYHFNNESIADYSESHKFNDSFDLYNPEAEGNQRFKAWYTDASLSETYRYDFHVQGRTASQGDLNLYAKWTNCVSISGKITVTNNPLFKFDKLGYFYTLSNDLGTLYYFTTLTEDGYYSILSEPGSNVTLTFDDPFKKHTYTYENLQEDIKQDFTFTQYIFTLMYDPSVEDMYIGQMLPPSFKILNYTSSDTYYIHINNEEVIELYDDEISFPSCFHKNNGKIMKVNNIEGNHIYINENLDIKYYHVELLGSNEFINRNEYIYLNNYAYDYTVNENEISMVDSNWPYYYLIYAADDNYRIDNLSYSYEQNKYTIDLISHTHEFNSDIQYIWNGLSCTAKIDCISQEMNHTITETVPAVQDILKPASNFSNAYGNLHANFVKYDNIFKPQDKYNVEFEDTMIDFDVDSDIDLDNPNTDLIINTSGVNPDYEINEISVQYNDRNLIPGSEFGIEGKENFKIVLHPIFLKKLKAGYNDLKITWHNLDSDAGIIVGTSIYIEPTDDNSDLVIYSNKDNCLLFSNGEQIDGPKVDGLNVWLDKNRNIYVIEVSKNLTLSSKDKPIISSNNGYGWELQGKEQTQYELTLKYDDDSTVHSNILESDGILNIRVLNVKYDEVMLKKDYIDSTPDHLDKSFLYAKDSITVYGSKVTCKNYHSIARSENNNIYIYGSYLNHDVYGFAKGFVASLYSYANTDMTNSTLESSTLYSNPTTYYNLSAIKVVKGDVSLNNSVLNFEGNSNCNETELAVISSGKFEAKTNSTVNISKTTIGIYAETIFDCYDSNININCKYGAILAKQDIIFRYEGKVKPTNVNITTTSTNAQTYGDFSSVYAIKSLNNVYTYKNVFTDLYFVGSINGVDYFDYLNDDYKPNQYRYIKMNNKPVIPTKDEADLVINQNAEKYLLYVKDKPYGDEIFGLDVEYNSETDTYDIYILQDVNLYPYNEDCIYTNHGYNLKIVGDGVLNIYHNVDPKKYCTSRAAFTGIYSTGSLFIGDSDSSPTIKYYDNLSLTDKSNPDFEYTPIFNALYSYNDFVCAGSTIYSSNYGNVIVNDNSDAVININGDSVINHYPIDVDRSMEYDDSYDSLGVIYSRNNVTIKDSTVTSSFTIINNNSNTITYGIDASGSVSILNSTLNISGNPKALTNSIGITSYNDLSKSSTILIENSELHLNNLLAGITSMGNVITTITNTYLDIETKASCISSQSNINFNYDDAKYFKHMKLYRNYEMNDDELFYLPVICKLNNEGASEESIYNYLYLNLPEDYYIQFSYNNSYFKPYEQDEMYDYNYCAFRYVPYDGYDLTIAHDNEYACYYENELINGSAVDDLQVSYEDGTYILNVLDDVLLDAYDGPAINSYKGDLKIYGVGHLDIDLNNFNSIDTFTCGIYAYNNLQVGNMNSDKFNLTINDNFLMNNENHDPINSYSFGIYSEENVEIDNAKIIGNISSELVYSYNSYINILESELIHNVYANYKAPYSNDRLGNIVSLNADENVLLKNSSIKNIIVDYDEDSLISYFGINGKNVSLIFSTVDFNNYYDVSDGTINELTSIGIFTYDLFEATSSNISLNNFYRGIGAQNNIKLNNTNTNIVSYGSCLYTLGIVNVSFDDNENYNFELLTTNKGEIKTESLDTLPAIMKLGKNALAIPTSEDIIFTIPDKYMITTDIDKVYDVKNNNSYRYIKLVDNEVGPTDFEYIEMEEPKEHEDGHMPYYYDEENDKYYEDPDGEIPIEDLESWLEDVDHGCIKSLDTINHIVTISPDTTIKIPVKSNIYSFTSDASYCKYVLLYIDDKKVSKDNYEVSEGSTIITLTDDYINKLSIGEHSIRIVSKDGSGYNIFKVEKGSSPYIPPYDPGYIVPKTGIK